MNRTATRPAATFAALLGVLLHALVLVSAGLASSAASASGGASPFWSLCINGQIVVVDRAVPGERGQPAAPAPGMPACPLCAPSAGVALIPPGLPNVRPSVFSTKRVGLAVWGDPGVPETAVGPPARAPPYIA